MASESTIATQIRTALAQYLKRDASTVRPEDRLREDLGLDSLAMIELLFKIEEHFDLEIPNEDLSRITTVADVTVYVEEKLSGQPSARRTTPATVFATPAPPPVAAPAVKRPAAPKHPAKRTPAKVTSITAAARRKAARDGAGTLPAKKKKGPRHA